MKKSYIYKFNDYTSEAKPDFLRGKTEKEWLEGIYSNRNHSQLDGLRAGLGYRLLGWAYVPALKKYYYSDSYGNVYTAYAPNKALLRKSTYGKIRDIVEIK